jgi:hypothetical protein
MAKIALITDTHWGVRDDNQVIAAHQAKFYNEVFFPYIDEHDIKYIRHLGDIVDRRKYINYVTARNMRKNFIDQCISRELDVGIIIGNHDTFYKNTNEVNSMGELFSGHRYDKFKWYSDPTEEVIDGTKIVMMPWICADNFTVSQEMINTTDAQCLFGHLEVAGFEMYKGSPTEHGYAPDMFARFEVVCSGHFHHKSTRGNINYLGAPYEMTWSDYDDPRGFHVFDTDTRELTFIQNPFNLFHKLHYNDQNLTLDDILNFPIDQVKDSYVKLIVNNKTNPYWFDLLVERIEKLGVVDLKVIDDSLSLEFEDGDSLVNEVEDTLTMMRNFASPYTNGNASVSADLDALLTSLYNEALTVGSEA